METERNSGEQQRSRLLSRREALGMLGALGGIAGFSAISGDIPRAIARQEASRLRRVAELGSDIGNNALPVSSIQVVQEVSREEYSFTDPPPLREVMFGDGSLVLHLGRHDRVMCIGNLCVADLETSIPVRIPYGDSPTYIYIDGLPNIAGVANYIGRDFSEIASNQPIESKDGISVYPIQIPDDNFRGVIEHMLRRTSFWVPFDTDGRDQSRVAVDPFSSDELGNIIHFFSLADYRDFERTHRELRRSLMMTTAANMLHVLASRKETMSRRDFFRRITLGAATLLTGKSIASLGDFLGSKQQLDRQLDAFFSQIVYPSEPTPRGFRGVVEHYLNQDTLHPFLARMVLRDLIAAYKQRAFHDAYPRYSHHAVWGAMHENQIGLLEMSPLELLSMLEKFSDKHSDVLTLETFAPSFASNHALYSATEYRFSVLDGGKNVKIEGVNQIVFHPLEKLYQQLGAV